MKKTIIHFHLDILDRFLSISCADIVINMSVKNFHVNLNINIYAYMCAYVYTNMYIYMYTYDT